MRCRACFYFGMELRPDGMGWMPDRWGGNNCGLHGGVKVDPDGEQQNLDNRGGCGYHPRQIPVQTDMLTELFGV